MSSCPFPAQLRAVHLGHFEHVAETAPAVTTMFQAISNVAETSVVYSGLDINIGDHQGWAVFYVPASKFDLVLDIVPKTLALPSSQLMPFVRGGNNPSSSSFSGTAGDRRRLTAIAPLLSPTSATTHASPNVATTTAGGASTTRVSRDPRSDSQIEEEIVNSPTTSVRSESADTRASDSHEDEKKGGRFLIRNKPRSVSLTRVRKPESAFAQALNTCSLARLDQHPPLRGRDHRVPGLPVLGLTDNLTCPECGQRWTVLFPHVQ